MDWVNQPGWPKNTVRFKNVDDLIKYAMEIHNCFIVIDEAYVELDRYDKNQEWLGKSSRHFGHACLFIGHNLVDITKGIRQQCTQIFIMGCSLSDAKDLANTFDDQRILKATKLPTGHFVRVLSHEPGEGRVTFGHVDQKNMKIVVDKVPTDAISDS